MAMAPVDFLHPGDVIVKDTPGVIHTVLGSCVAVTFHDPLLKIGGICHAMLPEGGGEGEYRFLDQALEFLVCRLKDAGANLGLLESRLFGGADVRQCPFQGGNNLGAKNIAKAESLLFDLGIPLVMKDVGGTCGRRLQFFPHSGESQVRKVKVGGRAK